MLPHTLSNGICSLNHDVDRLTLSCIMRFDSTGKLLDHRIVEGVINVNNRMNYTDVNKLLNKTDDAPVMQYMHLMDMLEHMKELSRILREKREKRGSIDFDVPETKIIVDKDGKPVYGMKIITSSVEFAESKGSNNGGGNTPASAPDDGGFMNIPDNIDADELPF
jgi:ribonuclease R